MVNMQSSNIFMETETKKHYTTDGQHPEDAIYEVKKFINELQNVQETYFTKLVTDLNLTTEGEDWLFDYVYNASDVDEYDGFGHYLEFFKKKYSDLVQKNDNNINPADTFLSTDFGEFSPMMHMSSCEPDLETTFPTPFESDQVSSELDTITFETKDAKP